MKKLNWQGYSNNDRNEVLDELKQIISDNNGFIVNFNMFSDLALSLSVEIEENKINLLYKDLLKIIVISEPEPQILKSYSETEYLLFINVSFAKGKGTLKQVIPDVPS